MPRALDPKPTMRIQRTNAAIYDQNITFNETGLSFNEAGYAFGGLYEYAIVPLVSLAPSDAPHVVRAYDFQGTASSGTVGAGLLIGILGLTYPE